MSRVILAHTVTGSGPAVVLLHSGVADRRMWQEIQPALADRFRVVSPDLRGFGDSPLPGVDFTDADDVAALLDELEIGSAAVVGSSLGGRVALELATLHPERVTSLVLLCPAFGGGGRTPAAVAFGEAEDRLLEAGDVAGAVELNVRTWLGPEASEATRDLVRAMQRRAFYVQLEAETASPPPRRRQVDVVPATVRVPAVVVTGERDLDHFQDVGRFLASEIPGAEHVHLPWAGHLPSLERPDVVGALVLDALGGGPGASDAE